MESYGYIYINCFPCHNLTEETAQLHADQEDQSCFGQRSTVWRYPLPVFLRKTAEGTVEGRWSRLQMSGKSQVITRGYRWL